MIEGAVKHTRHDHPNWQFTRAQRESIAKRASGTIVAYLATLCATESYLSDSENRESLSVLLGITANEREGKVAKSDHFYQRLSPLARFKGKLQRDMKYIRNDEHPEYVRAMVDVLKRISNELS